MAADARGVASLCVVVVGGLVVRLLLTEGQIRVVLAVGRNSEDRGECGAACGRNGDYAAPGRNIHVNLEGGGRGQSVYGVLGP